MLPRDRNPQRHTVRGSLSCCLPIYIYTYLGLIRAAIAVALEKWAGPDYITARISCQGTTPQLPAGISTCTSGQPSTHLTSQVPWLYLAGWSLPSPRLPGPKPTRMGPAQAASQESPCFNCTAKGTFRQTFSPTNHGCFAPSMKSPGQNQYLIRIKTLEFSIKQHSLQPRLLLPSRQTTTRPRPKRLKPSSPPFQPDSTNLSRQYQCVLLVASSPSPAFVHSLHIIRIIYYQPTAHPWPAAPSQH